MKFVQNNNKIATIDNQPVVTKDYSKYLWDGRLIGLYHFLDPISSPFNSQWTGIDYSNRGNNLTVLYYPYVTTYPSQITGIRGDANGAKYTYAPNCDIWYNTSNSEILSAFNSKSFTYNIWINWYVGGGPILLYIASNDNNVKLQLSLGTTTVDIISFRVAGTLYQYNIPDTLGSGWNMYTLTRKDNIYKVYFNGQLVITVDSNNSDQYQYMNIGYNYNVPSYTSGEMGVDECRIYSVDLVQEQIQYLFDNRL